MRALRLRISTGPISNMSRFTTRWRAHGYGLVSSLLTETRQEADSMYRVPSEGYTVIKRARRRSAESAPL